MSDRFLFIAGLVINFFGCVLLFCDSWRTSSRFTDDAVLLGYGSELSTFFWRWCGRLGIALLAIGFVFQLVGYLTP
jgi:hypothetical protein